MDSTKAQETNIKLSKEMSAYKPAEEPPTTAGHKEKKRIEIRLEFPILFDNKNVQPMTAIEETQWLHKMLFNSHKNMIKFVEETGDKALAYNNRFPEIENDWKGHFKFYDKRVRGGTKPMCFFILETEIPYNDIRQSLWRSYIQPPTSSCLNTS